MTENRWHPDLQESLAALCHEQWSGWMRWMIPKVTHPDPDERQSWLDRWTRQMNTSYEELSEQEKASDREEARKFMALLAREAPGATYVQMGLDEGGWECSACGDAFWLNQGTPGENNMRYCPHCGARIVAEKPFEDEFDDEEPLFVAEEDEQEPPQYEEEVLPTEEAGLPDGKTGGEAVINIARWQAEQAVVGAARAVRICASEEGNTPATWERVKELVEAVIDLEKLESTEAIKQPEGTANG